MTYRRGQHLFCILMLFATIIFVNNAFAQNPEDCMFGKIIWDNDVYGTNGIYVDLYEVNYTHKINSAITQYGGWGTELPVYPYNAGEWKIVPPYNPERVTYSLCIHNSNYSKWYHIQYYAYTSGTSASVGILNSYNTSAHTIHIEDEDDY